MTGRPDTHTDQNQTIGRRAFLAGAAAAASFTIVKPSAVRGSEANSTIELGLIGCGGRGNWITRRFEQHGKYKFVACADYYEDHANKTGDTCGIAPNRRYATLSGYKKLLGGKMDAVVIETPPYFHPEQAAAAVEAGKHVYLAKPIAVDVPGCNSIAESGRKAAEKKLVFLVDFQTRANEHYREAARRVHAGQIGSIIAAEARYPTGHLAMKAPKTPEDTLRNWYCIRAISGDFIVEQSIHALDVASWFLNAEPVRVYGTGGSKGLRSYGDIWDHFNLVYEFPNNVVLSFYSLQMAHGSPSEIICRVYGKEGTVDTNYYTHVWMHCADQKRNMEGTFKSIYESGTVVNIKEFYDAVTGGNYENATVAPSVRSNLTTIMGRNAAYKGEPLTWTDLMKSDERYEVDLRAFKA